jgi:hypothetical protein
LWNNFIYRGQWTETCVKQYFQETWSVFKSRRETFWASTMMMSPLNNVFTFRNAHMCLQWEAYQARRSSNFPRQMTRAFHMHKPTAKESPECVIRETPGRKTLQERHITVKSMKRIKKLVDYTWERQMNQTHCVLPIIISGRWKN